MAPLNSRILARYKSFIIIIIIIIMIQRLVTAWEAWKYIESYPPSKHSVSFLKGSKEEHQILKGSPIV